MVFDKLFGWKKKRKAVPDLKIGRYSDNNKTVEQVNRWTEADKLFREQQYHASLDAFFDYLRDDEVQNVVLERNEKEGRFSIYQGSKIVRGEFDETRLRAEVTLASMPEPSVPVMRRLLEMNFHLYYSRYALEDSRLCMRFDSDMRTANPNKLYYGLKELATKADKNDDLLVHEFSTLKPLDTEHIIPIPEEEKKIKFEYMQKWLKETLELVATLDPEKFSAGIAYLLLTLVFRIDFMITPEGKLMQELEKVVDKYYRKEEKTTADRNQQMIEALEKLKAKTYEEVNTSLFRSKYTFSIVSPQNQKTVSEAINGALQNMYWYRDNNYASIANQVMEYGLGYAQFSYSLPRPLTELFRLYMLVNHSDYFEALGFQPVYKRSSNQFEEEEIEGGIEEIVRTWKKKHPRLEFNIKKLRFDNLIAFNQSFVTEVAQLNFES